MNFEYRTPKSALPYSYISILCSIFLYLDSCILILIASHPRVHPRDFCIKTDTIASIYTCLFYISEYVQPS